MLPEKILPCVCLGHEKTVADSCEDGMPVLIPHGVFNGKILWNIKCPKCGRGGCLEEKSVYYALKKWNEIQEHCRNIDKPF